MSEPAAPSEEPMIREFCRVTDADDRLVRIYDCYPIGNRQIAGPQGPMMVPVLGTMNWCVLEGIRVFCGRIRWYYFPVDQSEETHNEFQRVYSEFSKQLEASRVQHAVAISNLKIATPEDIKRMEDVAKNMGIKSGVDLLSAMKEGRPARR
jgi:hypothetical protein